MKLNQQIEFCNSVLERVTPNDFVKVQGEFSIYVNYTHGKVVTFDKYEIIHKSQISSLHLRFRHYLMIREVERHLIKLIEEGKILLTP